MSKNINRRMRARRSKIKASHSRAVTGSQVKFRSNEKPHFDKEVEHLPKAVVERQAERLMRENKQTLDALSKL